MCVCESVFLSKLYLFVCLPARSLACSLHSISTSCWYWLTSRKRSSDMSAWAHERGASHIWFYSYILFMAKKNQANFIQSSYFEAQRNEREHWQRTQHCDILFAFCRFFFEYTIRWVRIAVLFGDPCIVTRAKFDDNMNTNGNYSTQCCECVSSVSA